MREILYRGKSTDDGKWVYGIPVPITINCYDKGVEIIEEDGIEYDEFDYFHPLFSSERVIPESVGQFTGLYDKNNTKIFEGDTVKNSYGNIKVVEYHRGYYYPFVAFPEYTAWDEKECEVVGNAYDFLEASNKM